MNWAFGFERRRWVSSSRDEQGLVSMVTKGALEEMLAGLCYVEYKDEIIPLTDQVREELGRSSSA